MLADESAIVDRDGEGFCVFIYPFFFCQDDYRVVLERLWGETGWRLDAGGGRDDKGDDKDYRHLRYFYPYAREFLFPACTEEAQELLRRHFPREKIYAGQDSAPGASRTGSGGLNPRQWEILRSWQVVRWRWHFADAGTVSREFDLDCGASRKQVRCSFEKVSLLVFPTGVGLLLLDVRPRDMLSPEEFGAWAERFGTLEPLPSGVPAARIICRSLGGAAAEPARESVEMPLRQLIEEVLLRPLASLREKGSYAAGEATLGRYLFWCYPHTLPDGCWREVLRVLNRHCRGPLEEKACFTGINTWAYFTSEGATVVSCGNEGFTCQRSREYWRTIYFDLFLHAFYHRLSLLRFARELSRTDELIRHAGRVRQLHRRFLEFSNKAWFNLLVHADYGNLIWKKWREVMETETLYGEVRGYLAELGSFLEEERRAWYKSLSGFLVVVGFAVNLIGTVFTVGLVRAPSGPELGWPAFVLVVLATLLVTWLLLWAGQQISSRRDKYWKLRSGSGGNPVRRRFPR